MDDQLKTSLETELEQLLDALPDATVVVDADGKIVYANRQVEGLVGHSAKGLLDRPVEVLVPKHARSNHVIQREVYVRHARVRPMGNGKRLSAIRKDGTEIPVEISLSPLKTTRGLMTVAAIRDATERIEVENALIETSEGFRTTLEEAPIGVVVVHGAEGRIERANRAFATMLGYSHADLVGRSTTELMFSGGRRDSRGQRPTACVPDVQLDQRYRHADGHAVWASVHASKMETPVDTPPRYILCVEDMTQRKAMEEHITHAALHDYLTDLPNRLLLVDRLERALARSQRSGEVLTVMFLDLDHFKLVNDSLGHDVGDHVLNAMADRILGTLRKVDTVARYGGDEFVIVCEGLRDAGAALELAQRVQHQVSAPLRIESSELYITASIGVVRHQGEVTSVGQLLRGADAAMYRAKQKGPSRIEFALNPDTTRSRARLDELAELHRAFEAGQLEVHYQPIVNLLTQRWLGAEALLRWNHPMRGLLLPEGFIDLIDESDLVLPVSRFVLQEACHQAKRWQEGERHRGPYTGAPHVAVNVSTKMLADDGFVADVARAIEASDLSPGALWLEITEGSLIRDLDVTSRVLRQLRALGVHLAIDDFGTDYASLNYLMHLPVEALKIDRSFVAGLGSDPKTTSIARAFVSLARSLELQCVAEGVETRVQADLLRDLGCEFAQGFFFSQPVPAKELGRVEWGGRVESGDESLITATPVDA